MQVIAGWLFFGATVALFLWGVWMGYRGIRANHPAWLSFGHAPGASGSFDSRLARYKGANAA
jgi:hypothetical protein